MDMAVIIRYYSFVCNIYYKNENANKKENIADKLYLEKTYNHEKEPLVYIYHV